MNFLSHKPGWQGAVVNKILISWIQSLWLDSIIFGTLNVQEDTYQFLQQDY